MPLTVDIRKQLGNFVLDVSFEANNEIMALLGASGCGKSMTLKCIAGIEKPDEGVICLDGTTLFDSKKRINLPPQKRHTGFLFQNYALFPYMTVLENVAAGIHKPRKEREAIARKRIEAFYLSGQEQKYPSQLSGGQQQRVALARILATEPKILMLDEPFSAMDSYLRWKLEQELKSTLRNFNGTTLYVSHNRDEVYRICKRVCIMDAGASVQTTTVTDLFEHPATLSAAQLSGCKNYSRAKRISENEVFAADWGVTLRCAEAVTGSIRYIGVRAHHIVPAAPNAKNAVLCRVAGVIQDVFSMIITLLPVDGTKDGPFSQIRMELPKDAWNVEADTVTVAIEPQQILLLE